MSRRRKDGRKEGGRSDETLGPGVAGRRQDVGGMQSSFQMQRALKITSGRRGRRGRKIGVGYIRTQRRCIGRMLYFC